MGDRGAVLTTVKKEQRPDGPVPVLKVRTGPGPCRGLQQTPPKKTQQINEDDILDGYYEFPDDIH